ncbi:MAG: hypothetical protein EP343_06230 [Deltaproteobacteria bacterium]|nr:MAG: hypothetical protein EP343_06230 [Deltaproteobacteria bacterium]
MRKHVLGAAILGCVVWGVMFGVLAQQSRPTSQPATSAPTSPTPSSLPHAGNTPPPPNAGNNGPTPQMNRPPHVDPRKLTPKQRKKVKAAVQKFVALLKQRPKTPTFPCEPHCRYNAKILWTAKIPELAESSPRAADLNGDGVLDLVVGTGVFSMGGGPRCFVYAINGKNGKVLWRRQFTGDMYATPVFLHVNNDGIPDVVMTGRVDDVYALNGKTGQTLWNLKAKNQGRPYPKANFNTSVLVPDLDKDGTPDLLTIQGGEVTTQGITVGRLYQISGKTGAILKSVDVPDRREIYAIPSLLTGKQRSWLYVGTGGERIPGHVFGLSYPSFQKVWEYTTESKGVIASPLVHKFKGQAYPDVVANIFDGQLVRLDGQTGQEHWKFQMPGHESYTSPAVGRIATPKRRDVIAAYYKGVWPRYEQSYLVWVNSKTGKLIHKRPFGTFSLSSPLIADLNGDQFDEIIVSTNAMDRTMMKKIDQLTNIIRPMLGDPKRMADVIRGKAKRPDFLPKDMPTYQSPFYSMTNTVMVIDGKTRKIHWSHTFPKYSSSTPLLIDLDKNGKVDLLYVVLGQLVRFEFQIKSSPKLYRWNQFRGPKGDGVYRP